MDDYLTINGELIPLDTYLKLANGEDAYPMTRGEILQAFEDYAPSSQETNKVLQLLGGLVTVSLFLIIFNFIRNL